MIRLNNDESAMIYKAGSWEIFPSRRKFYLILYKFIVSDKSVARPFCDGLRCRLSPKLKKQSQ